MKKLLIILAALVTLGGVQAQGQCSAGCVPQQTQVLFPDVPAGHWASDAVDRITDLGIIIGFPDGTFRGNETLTRYQAALMFDRLINLLNANLASLQTLGDVDIEALRLGVESLSGQVSGLAERVSANEIAIASISRDYGVSNVSSSNAARISELEVLVSTLSNRPAQQVVREVQTVQVQQPQPVPAQPTTVTQQITQVVGVPDELVARINANAYAASRIDAFAVRVEENSALIARLSALAGRLDVLGEQDTIILSSIEELNGQIENAYRQANLAMDQANLAIELLNGLPSNGVQQTVSDARIPQLEQRITDNARYLSSLNDLVALFNADLMTLQGDVASLKNSAATSQSMVPEIDFTPLETDIASNRSQIQGIREFVILLRRNQVAFDSRLDSLEDLIGDSVGDIAADVADLTERVDSIEGDLLTFDGSIAAKFQTIRIDGEDFDVDRIFGHTKFDRTMASSSTFGDEDNTDDDFTSEPGSSIFSTNLKVNLGFARPSGGAVGDPRALNQFGSAVTLKLVPVQSGILLNTSGDAISSPYVFSLGDALFYYSPIGEDLLTFGFGEDVDVTFSDYVLNTNLKIDGTDSDTKQDDNVNTPGVVGHLNSPEFLEFLDPKLTVVYTSTDVETGSSIGSDHYVLGVRGEMAPQLFDGFESSGGVSFVTSTQNDAELRDDYEDNITTTVFGVDGKLSYSPFSVEFEWAQANRDDLADDEQTANAFFVTVGVDPFDISILSIKDVELSYRDIDSGWTTWDSLVDYTDDQGDNYNGQATKSGRFDDDQSGIRADVDFGLFIFDVESYFDNYFVSDGDIGTTAFGLDADINIFASVDVTGFFHSASIQDGIDGDYVQVDTVKGARPEGTNPTSLTGTRRDGNNYDTGFGFGLEHDGDADNALVSGLNFNFDFARIHAGFDTTRIRAGADYELDVSVLNLTPYVNFESIADPDEDEDSVNTTTINVGTGIETDTFDLLFKPSLEGVVNYRTRSYDYKDSAIGNNYTTSQLQFSVGLTLNEFLLPYSVLTARYGNFIGTNTAANPGKIFSGSNPGANNDDVTSLTSGYEITWDYYDLEFAYGVYTNDGDSSDSSSDPVTSQAFRIKYKVTF